MSSPPVPEDSRPPRTPRWVTVLAIVGAALLLLLVVGALLGVEHGPGLHR